MRTEQEKTKFAYHAPPSLLPCGDVIHDDVLDRIPGMIQQGPGILLQYFGRVFGNAADAIRDDQSLGGLVIERRFRKGSHRSKPDWPQSFVIDVGSPFGHRSFHCPVSVTSFWNGSRFLIQGPPPVQKFRVGQYPQLVVGLHHAQKFHGELEGETQLARLQPDGRLWKALREGTQRGLVLQRHRA